MTVYVIRADMLVKIGFSQNLRSRVSALMSGSPFPIEFVGHMPGGREVEKHLHDTFAAHHHSGEWFVETEAMRTVFETILTPGIPRGITDKARKRQVRRAYQLELSEKVQAAAKARWPTDSVRVRVNNLTRELQWAGARARDVYYASPTVSLRAYELQELECWLGERKMVNVDE